MTIEKSFNPAAIEAHWYPEWERRGYFESQTSGTAPGYCIQLPPPNVTGTLHMGHAFQQTLMDALIRYHRMRGLDTNWVAGTDHAGIATQIVVERQLQEKGQNRHDLGRKNFVAKIWEWKEKYGGIILKQLRALGASCDWSRTRFTMDPEYSRCVQKVFVDLACSSHNAMWEKNRLLLFRASLEWLQQGTVNGKSEGLLQLGY